MADEEEDLPELDFADPLKRGADDEEDDQHGLDPVITIPPED
jgi:hypothetical protein